MKESLAGLTNMAIAAAKRAGDLIQSATLDQRRAQQKEGGSSLASQVVTEVDLASQQVILEDLENSIVEHELGLLTEESADDASRHQQDYFWCIDPLDGTLPFIEGKPGYSVSIALVSRAGEPQLGVIYDPVSETLYHASRGAGVSCNGRPWRTRSADHLTLVMDRSLPNDPLYKRFLPFVESLSPENELKLINQGGAALNACWVLEHAPALYVKFPKKKPGGGSIWDFAASTCLFVEAGAAVSDIRGHPLKLNKVETTFMNADGVVYASNSSLARGVIDFYEKYSM